MSRRIGAFVLATTLAGAAPPTATVPVETVKAAFRSRDAMALREVLLPRELAERVEVGRIIQRRSPGWVFEANYLAPPLALAPDVCTRAQFRVSLAAEPGPTGLPNSGSDIVIGPVQTFALKAIAFPQETASAQACKDSSGYVHISRPEALADYRRLVSFMRAAAGPGELPFTISCTPREEPECTDPRRVLARLPLAVLWGVDVGRYKAGAKRGYIDKADFAPSAPHDVEFSFGNLGKRGRSWRVLWHEDANRAPTIFMQSLMVL